MEQQQNQQQQPPAGGVPGPTGRRLHIAHRRSPSELTPLMSMYANPGSEYSPFSSSHLSPSCNTREARDTVPPLLSPTAILVIYSYQQIANMISSVSSGAACYPATNRASTAAATTVAGYTPTIHQHGYNASWTNRSWRLQPYATRYSQHGAAGLPVPQPASTATTKRSAGSSESAHVTSP